MTPDQQREETLFTAALAKPPAERAAFLDGACHGDAALRARLEALLAEHEQPDELTPALGPGGTLKIGHTTVLAPVTEQAGDRIGPYKLREKIGEGGCGVVYVAEQEKPVRRRVALKVIKLGMDTREVIARFEAERQALAMMDHPNIAKVLDAGATGTGRPYFVMELVRGIRISDYCDQHNLSTKDRLDLFMKVCHAIQHAHQKGIIHRDIKPSNILVTLHDGVPVPKVIDFGIAKATEGRLTDATVYTQLHQFIGTPAYMSPEQAEMSGLDIDTRSDIYSLGVLLYELLTGQTPFDAEKLVKSGLDEIRRTIREVEPPKPSTCLSTMVDADLTQVAKCHGAEPSKFTRRVRGDLDWIVMTCLEKDRTRRYETANGIAMDIQRHLNNEPIRACPPSAGYQFRKFARRQQAALRVAAGIAVLLVAATAVSTWQAVRATTAERRTAVERDKKELARQDAEGISKFLSEVFRSPDPARDGRTITVAETLDKAARKLETDLAAQPGRRTSLQTTLGVTYSGLGLDREAIPLLEKVRNYDLATFGPDHPKTLGAMHNLAIGYSGAGRLNEALKLQEEVLTLSRKLNGPEHESTLRAMDSLASSYHAAGRQNEALKLGEELLAFHRKLNGPQHHDRLMAMENLASYYVKAGRQDEALKLREDVLAVRRQVLRPEHPETLSAIHNLAESYSHLGREDEALKLGEDVLTLRRKVNGPEHPDTLKAMHNLAISFSRTGRKGEALKLAEETLLLSLKVNGPEHPETLVTMTILGNYYSDAGRRDEALRLREEVLPLSCKVLGPESPETLGAIHNLANSYSDAGRKDEALQMRENVLPLRRKVNGPEHPDTIKAIHALGNSYADAGRNDEALKLREEELALSRKVLGPENPDTFEAMNSLSGSYNKTGRRDEAVKMHEDVLAGLRKVSGPEDPMTLTAMYNLALTWRDAGRLDEALKLGEEMVPLSRKVRGPEHLDTLLAMNLLTLMYGKAGRSDDARQLLEELVRLRRKVLGPEDRETLGTMSNLAAAYGKTGHLQEAVTLQEQTLAIKRRVLPPNDPYLAAALGQLANFYERTGRTEEAAALRKERSVARSNPPSLVVAMLVPSDSEWKWLHPTDGVDPAVSHPNFHKTFFTTGYDDSAWKSGKDSADPNGGFGYGRGFNGVDIGLPPDENHRHTAYFRHRFTTDKPHARLELRCQRDDAIIVYLDGAEVLRDNLRAGSAAYLLSATRPQGPENDGIIHRFPLRGTLAAGPHLLAISLHNTELPSSDLRIGGITLVETAEDPKPLPSTSGPATR